MSSGEQVFVLLIVDHFLSNGARAEIVCGVYRSRESAERAAQQHYEALPTKNWPGHQEGHLLVFEDGTSYPFSGDYDTFYRVDAYTVED